MVLCDTTQACGNEQVTGNDGIVFGPLFCRFIFQFNLFSNLCNFTYCHAITICPFSHYSLIQNLVYQYRNKSFIAVEGGETFPKVVPPVTTGGLVLSYLLQKGHREQSTMYPLTIIVHCCLFSCPGKNAFFSIIVAAIPSEQHRDYDQMYCILIADRGQRSKKP